MVMKMKNWVRRICLKHCCCSAVVLEERSRCAYCLHDFTSESLEVCWCHMYSPLTFFLFYKQSSLWKVTTTQASLSLRNSAPKRSSSDPAGPEAQLWAAPVRLGDWGHQSQARTLWSIVCKAGIYVNVDIVLEQIHTGRGKFFETECFYLAR